MPASLGAQQQALAEAPTGGSVLGNLLTSLGSLVGINLKSIGVESATFADAGVVNQNAMLAAVAGALQTVPSNPTVPTVVIVATKPAPINYVGEYHTEVSYGFNVDGTLVYDASGAPMRVVKAIVETPAGGIRYAAGAEAALKPYLNNINSMVGGADLINKLKSSPVPVTITANNSQPSAAQANFGIVDGKEAVVSISININTTTAARGLQIFKDELTGQFVLLAKKLESVMVHEFTHAIDFFTRPVAEVSSKDKMIRWQTERRGMQAENDIVNITYGLTRVTYGGFSANSTRKVGDILSSTDANYYITNDYSFFTQSKCSLLSSAVGRHLRYSVV